MNEFPVRCFTCGKTINHLYDEYTEHNKTKASSHIFFDIKNIRKMCCKRMFMCHVDLTDDVLLYKPRERFVDKRS